jgi:dinuclear metal center YbgI/SA1388 family protein
VKPTSANNRITHGDLIDFLAARISPNLAEEWDNCGLQVGSRCSLLRGVICCLDVTSAVVAEAKHLGADFILSHHPLLFRPLRNLSLDSFPGSLIKEMVQAGITLYTAHTNLDKVPGGVSDRLAEQLGLAVRQPLMPEVRKVFKLVTFVPPAALSRVEEALFSAGAGVLGKGAYRECAFRISGEGSFFPEEGSSPRVGEVGRRNLVPEIRFETVCEDRVLSRVLSALEQTHPYEVPAYDLYRMELKRSDCGLGRIGELEDALELESFIALVRERLGGVTVRLIGGKLQDRVKRVALCGGSGFSLYSAAVTAGADLYLTGDVKYHEAREIVDGGGIPLLDAGHFATERPVVEVCSAMCRDFLVDQGLQLPVVSAQAECDPWIYI